MGFIEDHDDIQKERLNLLNDVEKGEGDFGLYWMQRSQRVKFNHALEYAVEKANELGIPLT